MNNQRKEISLVNHKEEVLIMERVLVVKMPRIRKGVLVQLETQ